MRTLNSNEVETVSGGFIGEVIKWVIGSIIWDNKSEIVAQADDYAHPYSAGSHGKNVMPY
jgi:hypothetical protein